MEFVQSRSVFSIECQSPLEIVASVLYVDLEQPVPANGIPKPGPLDVHLKDDHMQYAITWFALAGAVVIAFAVWLRAQRRAAVSRE